MPPGMLLQAVLFLFLLVVVSVWDIKNREIPDGLQAAIALLSLLHFSPWNLAGALTALPYLLVALAGRGTGGIGGGDIKLAASMGTVLGLPASLTASVLGLSAFIVYGFICSCIRRLKGRKGRAAYPRAVPGGRGSHSLFHGDWRMDHMKKRIIITFCAAVPVVALAAFLRSRRKRYAVR